MRSPSSVPVSDPSANPKARQGFGCVLAFCSVFFLMGFVAFFFTFLRPAGQILAARSWSAVPCQITASSLVTGRDSDGDATYSADIAYSYTFNGQNHAANHYAFAQKTGSFNSQSAIVAQYPVGAAATCYVNPADPNDAVLNRAPTPGLWFGLLPLVFCAFGLGVPFLMFKGLKTRPHATWQANTPAVSVGATTLSPQAAALAGNSGPVVLKAQSTPGVRSAGLGCITLFWNGFILVFGWSILKQGWSGFNILSILFLIPFVLIGIVMLCAWVASVLALSNARLVFTLSRPFLRPGESAEVTWKLGGGKTPERVQVWLEGREVAIYQRGTDTLTARSLFFRDELADTTTDILTGKATLNIPLDTMHSLEAPNNKIIWTLTLLGHVARFPDVKEEFVVLVEPRI